MSAAQVVTMRSEEIPFELYNLQLDDLLKSPEDDTSFQLDETMPSLAEQLSFMPLILDSNSLTMFPETVTIAPLPATSPVTSVCSSPPFPATRADTPPSPYARSQPGSPVGRKSNQSSSPPPPGGGPVKPVKIPRHKRESHINAEHRRRHKIQTGLSDLQKYVPSIAESIANNVKDSKSSLLNKTSEHIRQLSAEHSNLQKEANRLRQEMETLSAEVNTMVKQLPVNGLEVPKPADPNTLDEMFRDYTTARTFQNWKFFMFGLMAKPLFQSFKQSVDASSVEEFHKTTMAWQEKHCSLTSLRPVVLQSLRELSKQTSVMTHPERLQSETLELLLQDVAGEAGSAGSAGSAGQLKAEGMS